MLKIICGKVIHHCCVVRKMYGPGLFLMALGIATIQMIVFRKLFEEHIRIVNSSVYLYLWGDVSYQRAHRESGAS